MLKLEAKQRGAEKNEVLRKSGLIPAVFYGAGKHSTAIAVDARDFAKIWKEGGEAEVVTLVTEQGSLATLIHEVQFDVVKGTPLHIDFLVVDVTKEVTVTVPLSFEGTAPGAKLGTLVKVLHEVSVSALPNNLPHVIEVDISSLETLEDQIRVSDIVPPQGVTIVTEGDEVVALLAAQKEEEGGETMDLSAIEVEKKGKKEVAE